MITVVSFDRKGVVTRNNVDCNHAHLLVFFNESIPSKLIQRCASYLFLSNLLQTQTTILTIDMILGTVKSESNKLTGKCPFLRWQKKAKIVTTISTVIFTSTPLLSLWFFKLAQSFFHTKWICFKTETLLIFCISTLKNNTLTGLTIWH